MKLGITLLIIGLAGTVLFLAAAVDFGNASLYASNLWVLVVGLVFFVIFLIGLYRFRKQMEKKRQERNRRW
jgi:membrane protein implicated in regulation of membrane protease activity